MTKTPPHLMPAPLHCPDWCSRYHPGPHTRRIGASEYGDEVTVKHGHFDSTPLIDVTRDDAPDLHGLTAEQALAIADLLTDNECVDEELTVLLRNAAELIKLRERRMPPVAAFLLRVFRHRAVA